MKKNMFKVAFVAAIALVCGINVFNAQKSEALSEVVLANVEALADKTPEIWIGTPCMETPDNYCLYLSTTSDEVIELPGVFAQ